MSLNVEEPYKEEEVLYQVQVRLNSRGRERVLKVKVYDCAPPLYIHSWRGALRIKTSADVQILWILSSLCGRF